MQRNHPLKLAGYVFMGSGILMLIYSFICRLIPVNFFWESRIVSFIVFFVGLTFFWWYKMKVLKAKRKDPIWYLMGIIAISILFMIQAVLIIAIPFSTPYQVARDFIYKNEEIRMEIGNVVELGFLPTGILSMSSDPNGSYGSASINFIIKGEKAFVTLTIQLFKDYDTEWEIYGIK